ncbi:hypothetical protein I8752_21965, partial [Nostocaceae cyanobacterium CENA369]|nr:hypothetical protein [Dendronalium phyllosphericum CENA369]
MARCLLFLICLLGLQKSLAQGYTRKDSLRGGFSFERTCYDVQRYDLNITINPEEKSIKGYNDITFKTLKSTQKIQVDLFENMKVDSILFQGKPLEYKR